MSEQGGLGLSSFIQTVTVGHGVAPCHAPVSYTHLFILLPLFESFMPLDGVIASFAQFIPFIQTKLDVVLYNAVPFNLLKGLGISPVSYTHLDVYKRQASGCASTGAARCGNSPGGPWFFRQEPDKVAKRKKFRFIQTYIGRWPVSAMCRMLKVSEQGYYYFLRRLDPAARDKERLEQIYQCLQEEPENTNYGVRRIIWWLRLHRDYTGGDRRIYRICRENHLMIHPKRRPNGITREDRAELPEHDAVRQAVRMIGNDNDRPFLRNIFQVPGRS